MCVDLDSRRYSPQSSIAFGRELSRLKQALDHKGFGVSDGRQRVWRIVRINDGCTDAQM
jgi:hypothetical protein